MFLMILGEGNSFLARQSSQPGHNLTSFTLHAPKNIKNAMLFNAFERDLESDGRVELPTGPRSNKFQLALAQKY